MKQIHTIFLLFTIFIIGNSQIFSGNIQDDIKFLQQMKQFAQENPQLSKYLEGIIKMFKFSQSPKGIEPSILLCQACSLEVGNLHSWDRLQLKTGNFLTFMSAYVCSEELNIFPANICEGIMLGKVPVFFNSFWNHYFNPQFLCQYLNLCTRKFEKVDVKQYIQDILKDKPNVSQVEPSGKNIIKIFQISDIHTELQYKEGSSSQCDAPTCCREDSVPKIQDGKPLQGTAGYWGSLSKCDIPMRTFDQMVSFVKKYLTDIDLAIWNGDSAGHNIWNQTQEENLQAIKYQTQSFKENFPNINFYPMFGNHEVFPVNQYEFSGNGMDQLKTELSDMWQEWIGVEAAQQLQQDGFYEVTIDKYNLKLIVLNTQAAMNQNFYLIQNPTDPGQMLEKLKKSLQESEDNNSQPVWITGHVPPGRKNVSIWSDIYNAIIERYSHIIRAQIYGHTHADEVGMNFDGENQNVNNIRFVAPSFTTYHDRNPSFRVYHVDAETLQVLNYDQYRLDLQYWNQITDPNTQIIWEKVYDFQSEYEISNMWNYQNMQQFREIIGNDLKMYNRYMNNRQSGVYQEESEINKRYYCEMLSTPKLVSKCYKGYYIPDPVSVLSGQWYIKKATNSNKSKLF